MTEAVAMTPEPQRDELVEEAEYVSGALLHHRWSYHYNGKERLYGDLVARLIRALTSASAAPAAPTPPNEQPTSRLMGGDGTSAAFYRCTSCGKDTWLSDLPLKHFPSCRFYKAPAAEPAQDGALVEAYQRGIEDAAKVADAEQRARNQRAIVPLPGDGWIENCADIQRHKALAAAGIAKAIRALKEPRP